MSIMDQLPELEKRWYAVKCKYRCERRLMVEFNAQGIECYVPIQKKIRHYQSRTKQSEVALIPSHIFVRINRSQYLPVLQHLHIFQFLNFSGVLIPIPESEMNVMRRVVGEIEDVQLNTSGLKLGDELQIIGGELTGLIGVLVEEGSHNFKIELKSLGMGLMINVDPKYLIKIGSKSRAVVPSM